MCGIFGFTVKRGAEVEAEPLRDVLSSLIELSESRGKEAAGLALFDDSTIEVHKEASRASVFIKKKVVRDLIEATISNERISRSHVGVVGHARLVTNGSLERHGNNQPVIRDGVVAIHNGIIVNDSDIFNKHTLTRNDQVDTEALLALLELFNGQGFSLVESVNKTYAEIRGTASAALLFRDSSLLVLATNNGSLYSLSNSFGFFFASERYILERIAKEFAGLMAPGLTDIERLEPGNGLSIDLLTATTSKFSLTEPSLQSTIRRGGASLDIHDHISDEPVAATSSVKSGVSQDKLEAYGHSYISNRERIDSLRRCSRCIMPETMPFIAFDNEGVCNFCRRHVKQEHLGSAALAEKIAESRGNGRTPDCIFPLSGGRDSSYGLHYVKEVLKMNPIAYSYDWGMLTDLGRRNQARMCGELGVEHLLVSADIAKKRQNIRTNVEAWLRKPDLGTIPLFMAGDKQYFYYLNKLRKQTGVGLTIYCENPLERTDFKYGFCGVAPKFDEGHVYDIGLSKKLALAFYYAKSFASNPYYLNSSLIDTVGAYLSTYFLPHDYLYLFNYLSWDEETIDRTLIDKYDWELAEDTSSSWRIGDGTAAFYNYIYYTAAGFTENDTFRSNQVREGLLTREKALQLARRDNAPRFESIRWYCETISIDMERAIDVVNAMPKLYR